MVPKYYKARKTSKEDTKKGKNLMKMGKINEYK